MGAADAATSVVDPECHVIGLEGLRVVDASVFPTVTNGNINAPAIMLAERASDLILGRPLLAPSYAPSWLPEAWEQAQRERPPVRTFPSEA